MSLTKVSFSMIDGTPINIVDYGAVGNGVADDTAAINAALAAAVSGDAVYFPPGNYKITSQITFNKNNVCLFGEGSSQTIITYAGASTTNDIFLMGDNVNSLINLIIKGIRVTSTVTMTGGFAFHFRLLVRSYINDVILEGQDGNAPSKLYGGFWFDKIDDVQITQFKTVVLNEGLRVNGAVGVGVPKAGLFVNDGKISGGTIGIRVGGAFGGIYVNMTDVIAMSAVGVKIDTDIAAEGNREVFLGPTCVIDSVSAGYGVHVTDALAGGPTLQMTGTWVASCSSHGVFFDNCGTWIATLSGCCIFNNSGDGVRANNNNPGVIITGSTIRNNGGFGVNATLNGNSVKIADNQIFTNTSGNFSTTSVVSVPFSKVVNVSQEILIGNAAGAVTTTRNLTLTSSSNNELAFVSSSNAALSNNMLVLTASGIGNSTAYDYIAAGNTAGGSFRVRGDGQIFADSGTILTPADYAEMFEWVDANPSAEDRVGHTVSLVGNKIKIAEVGETVIGVVSATPMIVGDAAPFRWNDAFLKDQFGRRLIEEYEVVEWVEVDAGEFHTEINAVGKAVVVMDREGGEIVHSYAADEIPQDVLVPSTATRKTARRHVKNPAWDQSQKYTPRQERPEWSAIGLLGKLPIKDGQIIGQGWIKMQNIAEGIDEYLIK